MRYKRCILDRLIVSYAKRQSQRTGLPPGPPGPSLLLATLLVYRYTAFTGWCRRLFGKSYTVRMPGTTPLVVTTDREVIKRVFTGDPLEKTHGSELLAVFTGENSVVVLEPSAHLKRRKQLKPIFQHERIVEYTDNFQELTDAELNGWRVGEEVRVQERAEALTFEVMMVALFGLKDPASTKKLSDLYKAIMSPIVSIILFVPFLSTRARFNPFGRYYWHYKDQLDAFLLRLIHQARTAPDSEQRSDVLTMLVRARDEDGNGLDDQTLIDELGTLVSAGYATSSTAMAWAVDMLFHNPQVLERARQAAYDGDDEYLDAVSKETLRIRPTIPLASGRHMLVPFPIDKWTIGREPNLIVDNRGVHHDVEAYGDPERFRPERFTEGDVASYAWLPFGGGARRCVGASLSLLQMRVFLRTLLTRFDLEPISPEPEKTARRGVTHAPAQGARVRVVRERPPVAPHVPEPVEA